MEWNVYHRVLHGVYQNLQDIPDIVHRAACQYEGNVPHRRGWNFPASTLQPFLLSSSSSRSRSRSRIADLLRHADYVIVYRRGDILTKRHELQHARYAIDPSYRQEVRQHWDSLTSKQQHGIRTHLMALGYPPDDGILLDEFQAYDRTEHPRFFGTVLRE
jgi:hypothetical protein